MVDQNQEVGHECQVQLDAKYGEGNCTFIQCDITDGDKLKGIGLYYSCQYASGLEPSALL